MDSNSLAAIVRSQSDQIAELQEAARKRDSAYDELFSKFAETNLGGVKQPPQRKGKSKIKPKRSSKTKPTPVPVPTPLKSVPNIYLDEDSQQR